MAPKYCQVTEGVLSPSSFTTGEQLENVKSITNEAREKEVYQCASPFSLATEKSSHHFNLKEKTRSNSLQYE